MKFIRVRGRVVPIFDKGGSASKQNENDKAALKGRRLVRVGTAATGVGLVASAGSSFKQLESHAFGKMAVGFARTARKITKAGPKYAETVNAARAFAKKSLSAGASSIKLRKASLGLIIGGVGLSFIGGSKAEKAIDREKKRQGIK